MNTEGTLGTADHDIEARVGIWNTICLAADDVRHRFRVNEIHGCDGQDIRAPSSVPPVRTWQLIEALSLLCVIARCDDAKATAINVFGKMGPIEIHEEGTTRYLWAQQTLTGEHSELGGRPDIVVTTSSETPHSGNVARIIEAKCVRHLGTAAIRAEFGKAYDLRVATYLVWSFYSPTSRAIAGAKGLGIDLLALGFDTERRQDLITNPEALFSHVMNSQEQARQTGRFALALEDAGREMRRKLLGLNRSGTP